jgi:hypothetical protein
VNAIQSGRARFILNTGDMVWWGTQGAKPSENPYWKLVYEDVLMQMPAADAQMQAAGLPGRVYPAVGNMKCGMIPMFRAFSQRFPI